MNKTEDESYDHLAKQIEGISSLLKNLNSYVVENTSAEGAEKETIRKNRFSIKGKDGFQGIPELPEAPEEDDVTYLQGNNKIEPKPLNDQRSIANTMKTT